MSDQIQNVLGEEPGTLPPVSAYESLRNSLLMHYRQSGCCGYGRRLGGDGRRTDYFTVSHLCPTALAILKQIEELF